MQTKLEAAVVVLYNPDEKVIENIETYRKYIKYLYIVDNTESETPAIVETLTQHKNVKLIHSGENLGVAKALNLGLQEAEKAGVSWLLTMDQDTCFDVSSIEKFIKDFYTLADSSICIYAPLHNPKHIQNVSPLIETNFVMTSANLVNVVIAKSLDGFDTNLFIDEVDHEFCIRVRAHGFKIMLNQAVSVEHVLGEIDKGVTLYPANRLYYMVRNYLYIRSKYKLRERTFFKERDKYLLKFLFSNLIYGKSFIQNIRMIFKGVIDYKTQRYGILNA